MLKLVGALQIESCMRATPANNWPVFCLFYGHVVCLAPPKGLRGIHLFSFGWQDHKCPRGRRTGDIFVFIVARPEQRGERFYALILIF